MTTAICVTGSARTVAAACTLRRTLENIASPLHADVFLSINVPSEELLTNVSLFINTLRTEYKIISTDIYLDRGYYAETSACMNTIGRQQAEGMVRCMRTIQSTRQTYDVIIRTRTDLYIPFRLTSLPHHRVDVAYVGFIGNRCNDKKAWWVDDRFAILPTRKVQEAYFYGYARDICRHTCRDGSCRAPECKLGSSLMLRNVTPIDIRPSIDDMGLQIIRSNCSRETQRKHWIRPSDMSPLNLTTFELDRLTTPRFGVLATKSRHRLLAT